MTIPKKQTTRTLYTLKKFSVCKRIVEVKHLMN